MEAFLTSGDSYFSSEALMRYQEMIKDPVKEERIYV